MMSMARPSDVAQTSVCWVETLLDPPRREESRRRRHECLRHEDGLMANSTTSGLRRMLARPGTVKSPSATSSYPYRGKCGRGPANVLAGICHLTLEAAQ